MNLTNDDFNKIEKALNLLPEGEEFNHLSKEEQQIIIDADTVMINLLKKKKRNNERISGYISEKRKSDKLYARSNSYKASVRAKEETDG